ncbi:site-specific integrase [Acinetobacter baumannii]|uniref:tyrosine-type recombinase/integrase n=1 Tax=Acinetobacter baumannii TaxID=470 RepID=UPI0029675F3B|nr:site-specific integrase [Acinetobacter baumannii]MDW3025737.1 site-specific integrase [Acinetobacter baumannii]
MQVAKEKSLVKIEPHIRYISKFKLKRLVSPQDMSIEEYAKGGKYDFYELGEDLNNQYKYYINDYVAQFPVIIKNDGKMWQLSNLYLVSYMLVSSDLTGSTLKAIAMDLLDYYRFVSERNLDFFHFPKLNRLRVSYQYRNYLLNEVYEGRCHRSTASRRINRVVDFYDRLLTNGFISSEDFDNEPFERIIKRISLNNTIGLEFQKIIQSSNLAISNPKKNKEYDLIKDGGNLRPLTIEQQKIFLEYLIKYGNRQLQLMCIVSLLTGARLQTIGTLRVFHIKSLIKKIRKDQTGENFKLNVGGKTGVDTKMNKTLSIIFPIRLIYILNKYINSQAWRERALKNYYGATEQGYVFTTKSGLPYYTSISEIIDIKNDPDRKQFPLRRGEAVRKNLEELLARIHEDHNQYVPFRFHDLRATFGMNYLRFLLNSGYENDQCLLKLKEIMGHSNISTTLSYLDYREITEKFSEAQDKLETDLFGSFLNGLK